MSEGNDNGLKRKHSLPPKNRICKYGRSIQRPRANSEPISKLLEESLAKVGLTSYHLEEAWNRSGDDWWSPLWDSLWTSKSMNYSFGIPLHWVNIVDSKPGYCYWEDDEISDSVENFSQLYYCYTYKSFWAYDFSDDEDSSFAEENDLFWALIKKSRDVIPNDPSFGLWKRVCQDLLSPLRLFIPNE